MCGQHVPAGAVSCKECGACPNTGWSEDTAADGLDLPETEEEIRKPKLGEFSVPGTAQKPSPITILLVVALVGVLLWFMFPF